MRTTLNLGQCLPGKAVVCGANIAFHVCGPELRRGKEV